MLPFCPQRYRVEHRLGAAPSNRSGKPLGVTPRAALVVPHPVPSAGHVADRRTSAIPHRRQDD